MKILFYLPVATPWWFAEQLAPMLRGLHGAAELHVMVAPLWRNTGIEGCHLEPLADLDGVTWHIVDADDPALFRTDGAAVPGLLDLVREIAPDLTIARSADFATPRQFPGTVRYVMEGVAPPFDMPSHPLVLEPLPFCHGAMPAGAAPLADQCVGQFADIWDRAQAYRAPEFARRWRHIFGLPASRPVLAVPLQYEHEENFFLGASAFPTGIDLIHYLLDTLDGDIFLAITDHPLNRRFLDREELNRVVRSHPDRAVMCVQDRAPGGATPILAAHADALLVDLSKSWSLAAFCGTPLVQIGHAQPAPWLNVTPVAQLRHWQDQLPRPDADAMKRWFCWHLGTRIFHPQEITLERLMHHVNGTADEAFIASNAALLRASHKEAA